MSAVLSETPPSALATFPQPQWCFRNWLMREHESFSHIIWRKSRDSVCGYAALPSSILYKSAFVAPAASEIDLCECGAGGGGVSHWMASCEMLIAQFLSHLQKVSLCNCLHQAKLIVCRFLLNRCFLCWHPVGQSADWCSLTAGRTREKIQPLSGFGHLLSP